MTPADFRNARKALGLSQKEMAKALRLSEKNGDRSIRIWESDGNTVPGPVQVAVEFMLQTKSERENIWKTNTGNGGMTGFSLNLTLGENGGNQPLSADDSGKSPTQTLAKAPDGKTDNAEIIRELARAKVAFQLRAIKAVLGEVL